MSRHLFTSIFGQWIPPHWASQLGRLVAKRLATSVAIAVGLLSLIGGGFAYNQWQKSQSQREWVGIEIIAPGLTPYSSEEALAPEPILLQFDRSAAPLDAIDVPKAPGVRLEPSHPGEWTWTSDTTLAFQPKEDWPPGADYLVLFDPEKAFPERISLSQTAWPVTTPAMEVSLTETQFYQNPKTEEADEKRVTATIVSTHPLNEASLQRALRLEELGSEDLLHETGDFSLTFDAHRRKAYFRSGLLRLPEKESFLKVSVSGAVASSLGGASWTGKASEKTSVPTKFSYFQITAAETRIVTNAEGQPEQVLVLQTRGETRSEDLADALSLLHLPRNRTATAHRTAASPYTWRSASEVLPSDLQKATAVPLTLIPSETTYSATHSYRFSLDRDGQLLVAVKKGLLALGGYELGEDFGAVAPIPIPSADLQILGDGGVLALSGRRQIHLKSRGLPAIRHQLYRVFNEDINHLVSQTGGDFQNPYFQNYQFSEENIATLHQQVVPLSQKDRFSANYSTFDFTRYLGDETGRYGLFFLRSQGWQPSQQRSISSANDRRFILVTDLGLIAKRYQRTHEVFVQSIEEGVPVVGAEIEILAKNGTSLTRASTDETGRAILETPENAYSERTAVAIVARYGSDIAFMPLFRGDRDLELSRFDVGGFYPQSARQLDGFVFTERGVYRPDDRIHGAVLLKRRDWSGQLEGLPIRLDVWDPQGRNLSRMEKRVPASGVIEFSTETDYTSPTGVYQVVVSLLRDNYVSARLADCTFRVEEFEPEQTKITADFTGSGAKGWSQPDALGARITLANLYGTPAVDRRVEGQLLLNPSGFRFRDFADYQFFDPLLEKNGDRFEHEIDLGETTTNGAGEALFAFDLGRFGNATYELTFTANGFEAGSGKSVDASQRVLVSPLPYVVGFQADGDLSYIAKEAPRSIDLLALAPDLTPADVPSLGFRRIEQRTVSVLARQENGNFAYRSVVKDLPAEEGSVPMEAGKTSFALDTSRPGTYRLEFTNLGGQKVCQVLYEVVGKSAESQALERNAELELKLAQPTWEPGSDLEVQITAPYTGAGLLTIESDRVLAHKWFQTDSTTSIQTIPVPEDLEGTAYVHVNFTRSLDSPELFLSPLSYGVVPFTAAFDHRELTVSLEVPSKARPGQALPIRYQVSQPSQLLVFGVDEGILQITDYQLPDPLQHFFRKTALQVFTSQILDLVLPEWHLVDLSSAFGGGAEEALRMNLNPFKRTKDAPVVFWSGIIDAQGAGELSYEVPDYFNGTFRVMAVAASQEAIGRSQTESLIRAPFVITPQAPYMAAPGDLFEVSVNLANVTEGDNAVSQVRLDVELSEHLEAIQLPQEELQIEPGQEQLIKLTLRALEKPGDAQITLTASQGSLQARRRATLSVRPATPYTTVVQSGFSREKSLEVSLKRELLSELRAVEASASPVPLGLARGLQEYLEQFPHGCTEQLTSQAFSHLILADQADFGLEYEELSRQMERTFSQLRSRQDNRGSFGYWRLQPGQVEIDFLTTYVVHFLTEANERGFPPPRTLLERGLKFLQDMARLSPATLTEGRTLAYAIYLLSRNGIVTTNYLLSLRDSLEDQFSGAWQEDLTAVYLAGSYALLQQSEEALGLLRGYLPGQAESDPENFYYQPLGLDSEYFAVMARHFPEEFRRIDPERFVKALEPIRQQAFNTLTSAYAINALAAYSQIFESLDFRFTLSALQEETGFRQDLPAPGILVQQAAVPEEADSLRFTLEGDFGHQGLGGFFHTLTETGFDRGLPDEELRQGIEIRKDLLATDGTPAPSEIRQGENLTIRLRLRSLDDRALPNVAIVDLLPGGFEVDPSSLQPGPSSLPGVEYVDIREDRVVFYATAGETVTEWPYRIRPTTVGEFVLPPVQAESMYDRSVHARAGAGRLKVLARD
ncbi:MAG: alpha-2-macroglobulin [Verrucomicrobiota bacterium]